MAQVVNDATQWTYVLNQPMRILVVDDDPILREFATVHLSSPHVTIDTASDGNVARLQLNQHAYDAMLLDIEMPGLDGFALLREIRSNPKLHELPVIMLTAHEDVASIDKSYEFGATSFATKPVNWRQLSYQIRSTVQTSKPRAGAASTHPSP